VTALKISYRYCVKIEIPISSHLVVCCADADVVWLLCSAAALAVEAQVSRRQAEVTRWWQQLDVCSPRLFVRLCGRWRRTRSVVSVLVPASRVVTFLEKLQFGIFLQIFGVVNNYSRTEAIYGIHIQGMTFLHKSAGLVGYRFSHRSHAWNRYD